MFCAHCNKLFSISSKIASQHKSVFSLNDIRKKYLSSPQYLNVVQNLFGIATVSKRFMRRSTKSNPQETPDEIDSVTDFMESSSIQPDRKPVRVADNAQQLFSVHNPSLKAQEAEELSSEVKPKKAVDVALDIRREKSKQKSPFYELEKEELDPTKRAINALSFPSYDRMSDEDLASYVRKNIIYADKNMVVINKPYGIAIHDGDKISRNIKSILPMVSKMIYGVNTNIPLMICNRLDKFTTGVCIASTNEKNTSLLLKMFREHKILRKYWAITIDAPDPPVGVVDIPIDRELIAGEQSYVRMVTKPDTRYDPTLNKHIKIRSRGQIAITHYNTLSNTSLSLVELQPFTTNKHQLRVHLADGLDCPILGDHKYSHYGKLAPQNLPKRVLGRLGIPNSKTRYVPMHLHLQSILIPNLYPEKKKPHLILSATPPKHMTKTMNKFGLKPGKLTKWKGVDQAMGTGPDTAEPRNLDKKHMYVDPTVENNSANEIDPDRDLYEESYVFRKNRILVKYKH